MSDIIASAHSFEPGEILELFELDLSTGIAPTSTEIYRWHSGVDEHIHQIVWQGNVYTSYPIEAQGFEFAGKGSIPRPTLTVANVTSLISSLIGSYDDMVGAKVTRKRTFAKYLDSHCYISGSNLGGVCTGEGGSEASTSKSDCLDSTKNGGAGTWTAYTESTCEAAGGIWYLNSTADADADFSDEIWYIDRKAIENNTYVQFELSAAHDVAGVKLPGRAVVANGCPWKYRSGDGCSYTGTNYFDIDNNPVSSADDDVCAKTFKACEKRFPGDGTEIPFGGFPGAGNKSGSSR